MTHRFGILRRFRFNLPQRIAAGLLAAFLLQGLWVTANQTLSDRDYQYARCGRETWERPSALAGYFTTCGNIHDGILAYRVAGLPLTLNFLGERFLDLFRKPEDRVVQPPSSGPEAGAELSTWELRHQMTHILLLLRLPFLLAGCALGGCIWWVSRRLYGNNGGYVALALYCFCPAVLRACLSPNPEVLAGLGVFGGVYTSIGVAHAMQGPRRKWRPRIILLTVIFGIAAASHIVALPVAALLGLVAMLWIAEGRRSQVLPVLMAASIGALVFLFLSYGLSPDAFSYVFRSAAGFLWFSRDPAIHFFGSLPESGISVAAAAALILYLALRPSRYFGNTAPLFCFLVCMALVMTGSPGSPWIWSLPFLFTFIGGIFADAFDSPRRRIAFASACAILLLQAALCIISLAGMV
jgi:hypothetical protein